MKHKHAIWMLIFIILATAVTAAPQFTGETFKETLTTFEWCFDNPWNTELGIYKTDWNVYQDNINAEGVNAALYAELDATYPVQECVTTPNCTQKYDSKNDSTNTVCTYSESCGTIWKSRKEYYDVTKNDMLLSKSQRLCYKGTRNLKSSSSVDMNFNFDNGNPDNTLKAVDHGKAWWNSSCQFKQQITIQNRTGLNITTEFPIKIVLNSSNIGYTNFQDWNISFTDSTETIELDWVNISSVNTTGQSFAYVQANITNDTATVIYVYYNCSFAGSVSMNKTYGAGVGMHLPYNQYNTDMSDRRMNPTVVNTPVLTANSFDIERMTGHMNFQQGDPDRLHYRNPFAGATASIYTVALRGKHQDSDAHTEMLSYAWRSGGVEFGFGASSGDDLWAQIGREGVGECTNAAVIADAWVDDDWHSGGMTFNDSSNAWVFYWDGLHNVTVACSAATNLHTTSAAQDFPVGINYNNDSNTAWDGDVDEFVILHDFEAGGDWWLLWDEQPTYAFGGEVANVVATTMDLRLLDVNYQNITGNPTVDENQLFLIAANYTFDTNGSAITDAQGFCNYSSTSILDEFINQTVGSNTTLCTAGCDSTNYTVELGGLPTDGYIRDELEFKACHTGPTRRDFHLVTSCGAAYTFDFTEAPLCSVGQVNFTISDSNCTGLETAVNLSIWSEGTILGQSLRLVDSFLAIDRVHNHTEQMEFNGSSQLWQGDDFHKFFDHGTEIINVSCFFNESGVANQTGFLNVTVANVPPVVLIDTVWWWLLTNPVAFTNNVEGKYPLESTFNISAVVTDDDLDVLVCHLNFSNGTNINTIITSNGEKSVNYTQGNFSTDLAYLNGSSGYTFQIIANDTTSNETDVRRNFTVENSPPTVSWDNSTPLTITSVPKTVKWTCSDAENETGFTSYLFINNTNLSDPNVTTTGNTYLFNLSQAVWNLSVRCNDTFQNSSTADLMITYSEQCIINVDGLEDGARYQDSLVNITVSCDNSVNITDCWWNVNDFRARDPVNCTGTIPLQLELGLNRLNLTIQGNAVNASSTFNVWAKKYDSSILDYPVILFAFAAAFLFIMVAAFSRVFVFHFVAGIIISYAGWELVAFNSNVGYLVVICGAVYGITMAVLGVFIE